MSLIIEIAQTQLGVSRKTQSGIKAIKGYLWVSTHPNYNADIKVNWCGHFAYWVLYWAFNGNENRLPVLARPLKPGKSGKSTGWNTISRFPERYEKTSSPKPGDLYYRPWHPQYGNVHHIGFVVDPDYGGSGGVLTLDGNGRGGEVSADVISPNSIKYFLSTPE